MEETSPEANPIVMRKLCSSVAQARMARRLTSTFRLAIAMTAPAG
jgi:hypothetical protein